MTKSRKSSERGTTLVELLVVLIILGVVGSVVLTVIVTTFDSASATTQRVDALEELQLALQRVGRDLRFADGFVTSATDSFSNDLSVEITRDGQPDVVRYFVVEDAPGVQRLVREDTGFTLVTLLNNDEVGEPVFRYLDQIGREIGCNSEVAGDCAEAYQGAASIQVTFVRQIPGRSPVEATSVVSVRNIRYGGS